MKNFLKNVDFDQVKDQISDIKDQLQDIRFRKPWTTERERSPLLFIAFGAVLAWVGLALFRNRKEVAQFCSNCGADLKDKWASSGLKEKTERFMSKAKAKTEEAAQSGADAFTAKERFAG